jgi:phosphoglycerate dehydrogenase-like enzyme
VTLRVHLLSPPDPESLALLHELLDPGVELTTGAELPEPAAYEVLVAGRPQRRHVTASPQLRVVIIPWAGLPEETRVLLEAFPGLAVHNLHYNTTPVAEMAFALLLAAAKRIVPMDRALRRHDWTPRYAPVPSALLEGKTALILGYGSIGQRVARLCKAAGMHVIGIRRDLQAPSAEPAHELYPPEDLRRLLPRANALLICLPHTPETDGLIGAPELALLPPDALLVNIGRGPIVEQAALYHALRDGRLYGAGLDVWYNYPPDASARPHTPPADYPFHELDNVVLSPHRAGAMFEKEKERMRHLARLLNAAARGEPMPNRVDLERGY